MPDEPYRFLPADDVDEAEFSRRGGALYAQLVEQANASPPKVRKVVQAMHNVCMQEQPTPLEMGLVAVAAMVAAARAFPADEQPFLSGALLGVAEETLRLHERLGTLRSETAGNA